MAELTIINGQVIYDGTNGSGYYQYGQSNNYGLYSGMPTSIYQVNNNSTLVNPLVTQFNNQLTTQFNAAQGLNTQTIPDDQAAQLIAGLVLALSNVNQDSSNNTTHRRKSSRKSRDGESTTNNITNNNTTNNVDNSSNNSDNANNTTNNITNNYYNEQNNDPEKVGFGKEQFNNYLGSINSDTKIGLATRTYMDFNLDGTKFDRKDKELLVKAGLLESTDAKLNEPEVRKGIIEQADVSGDGKLSETEYKEWIEDLNNYDVTLIEKMDQKKATEVLNDLNSEDYAKLDKLDGEEDGEVDIDRFKSADLEDVLGDENYDLEATQEYFNKHENQLEKMDERDGSDDNAITRDGIKSYMSFIQAAEYAEVLSAHFDEITTDDEFIVTGELENIAKTTSDKELKEATEFYSDKTNKHHFDRMEKHKDKNGHRHWDGKASIDNVKNYVKNINNEILG